MTAPTTPTLEDQIAWVKTPPGEHPDAALGSMGRAILASLRRLATAEAELARMRETLELVRDTPDMHPTIGGRWIDWAKGRAREALGAKP